MPLATSFACFALVALASAGCSSEDDKPQGTAGAGGSSAGSGNQGGSAGAALAGTGGEPLAGSSAGGSAGSAGSGGAGITFPPGPEVEGTLTRPVLTAAAADAFTIAKYMEKAGATLAPTVDNWDPTAGVGDVATFTSDYLVAATGGTHTTVQAAVDAAVAGASVPAERVFIEVAAAVAPYRELVCVPVGAPPITLYSTNPDASATVIVFDNYSGKAKAAGTPGNPCNPSTADTTYGTSGSMTFGAYANGFQAKNLTIANDADETGVSTGAQAVALIAQGDQQIYENVRLLGNQDTFYAKSGSPEYISRVYVKSSFIEGDTDFIFGRATLVIDDTEIHFISSRQGSKGYAIVPSTDARNPYGMLVINSEFTADAATTAGSIHLGRAWDESGGDIAMYTTKVATGVYPNGQAVIRESTLGAHIRAADPWAEAATTKRPFSSVSTATLPANRLYEFGNTGPGSAAP